MQKVKLINASQKEAHWPPIFSFDILKLTYICVDIKNILFKKFNTFDNRNQHFLRYVLLDKYVHEWIMIFIYETSLYDVIYVIVRSGPA